MGKGPTKGVQTDLVMDAFRYRLYQYRHRHNKWGTPFCTTIGQNIKAHLIEERRKMTINPKTTLDIPCLKGGKSILGPDKPSHPLFRTHNHKKIFTDPVHETADNLYSGPQIIHLVVETGEGMTCTHHRGRMEYLGEKKYLLKDKYKARNHIYI